MSTEVQASLFWKIIAAACFKQEAVKNFYLSSIGTESVRAAIQNFNDPARGLTVQEQKEVAVAIGQVSRGDN